LPASEKAPQDGVLFSFESQRRNASAGMQAEAVQGALRYCLFKTPDEFASPSLQKANGDKPLLVMPIFPMRRTV